MEDFEHAWNLEPKGSQYPSVAEGSVQVEFRPEALRNLEAMVRQALSKSVGRNLAASGVLVGTVSTIKKTVVHVDAVEAISSPRRRGSEPLGHFRIQSRGELAVTGDDVLLADYGLGSRTNWILLIDATRQAPSVAVLFARFSGGKWGRVADFRVNATPRSYFAWGAGAAMVILLMGAALFRFPLSTRWLALLPGVSDSTANLELQIEGGPTGLRINWARRALIRKNLGGFLEITDGGNVRRIELSPEELLNESVTYVPVSGDVAFRLQIKTADPRPIQGFARYLDSSARPASNSSAGTSTNQRDQPSAKRSEPVRAPTAETPAAKSRAIPRVERANQTPPIRPPVPPQSLPVTVPGAQSQEPPKEVARNSVSLPPPMVVNPPPSPTPEITPPTQPGAIPVAPSLSSLAITAAPPEILPPSSTPRPPPVLVPIPSTPAPIQYVAAVPLRKAEPAISRAARSMLRENVAIEVRIQIDREGNVTAAVPADPSSQAAKLLGASTAQAALLWKFQPAKMNGQSVPSEITLRFNFTR